MECENCSLARERLAEIETKMLSANLALDLIIDDEILSSTTIGDDYMGAKKITRRQTLRQREAEVRGMAQQAEKRYSQLATKAKKMRGPAEIAEGIGGQLWAIQVPFASGFSVETVATTTRPTNAWVDELLQTESDMRQAHDDYVEFCRELHTVQADLRKVEQEIDHAQVVELDRKEKYGDV